jgi:hypothetical protein
MRRPPSSKREHYGRRGWRIMRRGRGGAILVGGVACAALAADTTYVALRWNGVGAAFGRGFASGVAGLLALMLIAKGLGVGRAVGRTPPGARLRAQRTNRVLAVLIGVFVILSFRFASAFAVLLGSFAALALLFAVVSFWAIRRPRSRSSCS